VDRRSLRRNENYEAFHEFVKMHTDIGTITRQEAVSMIPPIALDVQSHHKVWDTVLAIDWHWA
jgi:multisite-specific tRNA:(cytosine-C5)-methyltransferase